MLKTMSAVVLTALVGAAILLPVMAPQVSASASHPALKSDLADLPATCEYRGWPYYETACLRDSNRNAGRVPEVRVVSTDRIQLRQPDAPAVELQPQSRRAAMTDHPLAVPAWPEHIADLKLLAVR